MGECLIARGLSMDPEKVVKYGYIIKTEIITENTIWEVPGNAAVEKGVAVRIFGGGGGARSGVNGCGGGGGYMNNAILNLRKYEKITINIGQGGALLYGPAGYSNSGGTTIFGGYLSANGGVGGASITYATDIIWGSGGSGGGGGIGKNGCNGYQFGGGGAGGGFAEKTSYSEYKYGGVGGKWGGGGGGWSKASGGEFGGAGGTLTSNAANGTDISNKLNDHGLEDDLTIFITGGLGSGILGGGGGYGGYGGICINNADPTSNYNISSTTYNIRATTGAGGGGGWAANGGNSQAYSNFRSVGGGGGGYGGKGADGSNLVGGGGGGYGISNYGCGGGGTASNGNNGKSGVCIIQYYVKDLV